MRKRIVGDFNAYINNACVWDLTFHIIYCNVIRLDLRYPKRMVRYIYSSQGKITIVIYRCKYLRELTATVIF